MNKQLTDRQEEILNFIEQFRDEMGYPPTLREIGKKFDISSTFGVKRHLDALVKKGYLNVESKSSRGISLIKDETSADFSEKGKSNEIPIVGRVAAGFPILAEQNIEGKITIDSNFVKKAEDCFALKVKGDSMIDNGIFEGDLVIVNPKSIDAVNGEIVVAMLDGEATVKTFEKKNNNIKLIPGNTKYEPIEVDFNKEFSIVGKVVGVMRWLN